MHILITVNAAWNVLNFRRPLIEALQADGHSLTVLAPPDDAVEALRGLGCTFVPLEMDVKGLSPHRDLALMHRLRRHFQDLAPDAILSFTIKNNIYGALAARGLGVPFVPNVTGLGTAFLSTGLLQRIAEALYRTAFRPLPLVFFQNQDDRDLFLDRKLVYREQARLLPGSGIDLDRFAPTPLPNGPEVCFLLIARLLRDKGILEYVEAARTLRAEGALARFQLLGPLDGQSRAAISREMVEDWHREGCIIYLGESRDVRYEIGAADCVVLPSYYREGVPRVLLESCSMQRPIITTDNVGCRDVIEDQHTGFLIPVRDAVSLVKACRAMIAAGPNRRREMGQAGRAKMAREFDQALVVDAYRRALSDVASPSAT
mgnify:CR=1 FL=1